MAIESFRHKGLRRLFERDDPRGVRPEWVAKLKDILFALDQAAAVSDVDVFPGWRLHPLKGDLQGFWSITVSGNWRVVFRFERGGALDVDLIDYH